MTLRVHPWSVVTRGYTGGQYALATRGWIVCPDVVNRFPDIGDVRWIDDLGELGEDRLVGTVQDADWSSDVASTMMIATLEFGGIGGNVATTRMNASVQGVDTDADVVADESWTASVWDRGDWTALVESDVVVSSESDSDVRGSAKSTPGEGKC